MFINKQFERMNLCKKTIYMYLVSNIKFITKLTNINDINNGLFHNRNTCTVKLCMNFV